IVRGLAACLTVGVLCGSAVWFACQPAQPAAPSPGEFDEILRNPLKARDHSRRVDRLALTETAEVFRAGDTKDLVAADGKKYCVRLASTETEQVGFPRRGTWTGPETIADFPFTELVPSWNTTTPMATGVFFQVRTRDAKGREWSPWLFV